MIGDAQVGDELLAPVCRCGKHFIFRSMDMAGATGFICCPDYPAGDPPAAQPYQDCAASGHNAHHVDLSSTGEWDHRPPMYVMVHARRYAGIPCIVKGHVREVALQLAKFAKSKVKGRMTDSSVRCYAKEFETALRRDALKEETTEMVLVAYSEPFEVGTNAGECSRVEVPTTLHDIYEDPVEFEWRDIRRTTVPLLRR